MEKQAKTPSRPPSGIPRLVSRLPLPTSTTSRPIRPSPSRERLQADPGLDVARLRRPSEESVFKKPLPKTSSPIKPRESVPKTRDASQIRTSLYGGKVETETQLDEIAPSETSSDAAGLEDRGRGRGARPSLSERTIETLSQIPPSPAASVRRQSSFYTRASPIRSPSRPTSRPASSMTSYSRSPSRPPSRQQSGSDVAYQLQSTARLSSRSRVPAASPFSLNNASVDPKSRPSTKNTSRTVATARKNLGPDGISHDASTSSTRTDTLPIRTSMFGGSKDIPAKYFKARPSLNRISPDPSESEIGSPPPMLSVKKTRKPSSNLTSPSSTASKISSAASTSSENKNPTPEQQAESEMRKVSRSSSALRESIAKAKAARKAAAQKNSQPTTVDPWDSIDVQDPFNQRPKDSNQGLLRKRVEAARTSGHLNIAAMSLKELPREVMTMYDFDPNSSTDWYESVDLVKFIAADNELADLPDTAFPDIDPYDHDSDADEKGNQFGGLELLDLHGNLLRSLPLGIRRLQRLHTLNVSNNQLTMDDINVILEIKSLTDLKLASNNLQGPFTPAVSRLSNLETLDLRENSLTDIPETLAELTSLRVLNLGQNRLTSLPFQALSKLPLKELSAPKNKLKGTLIPSSVRNFETLHILNVASNELTKFSENEVVDLPNLQTLSLDVNRIDRLPDMSSWQALLTFSAEDNSLTEIPPGFIGLRNIKNVDFTGNNISRLDEKIGLMESLVSFRIANNPLRERKFLSMDTEDLKRDLRNRCEPEPQDTDEEGSVATQFTLAPETPMHLTGWQVKPGGVLDRSYADMTEFELDKLEALLSHDIRCLYLHHNELRSFPVAALSMLAQNLTDLDLSNNPLDSTSLFTSSVTLPNLQNLNLSATALTTLEPLQTNLSAPSLTFLDVSYNRLTGPLPFVRHCYPSLTTFLAADNQFTSLEFEAVRGLQVLDVSNNDIDSLPPKLGLLGTEGPVELRGGGSALRRLEVAGNSFRVPRWQIVAKGTDAILEWLKDRIPAEERSKWEAEEATEV